MRFKLIILGLLFVLGVNAQITNEGLPISWSMQSKKSITPMLMKNFDLKKIKVEDAKNDLNTSMPWRFGYELKVNFGLKNSGVWDEFANGDRIWRINIISQGAKTLNFIFDSYKIPRGATLYIYNNDRTDLLGAYTNIFNRPDEMLGTWLIEGDNVWIEYFEPASVTGKGKLNIAKVIHGYRSVTNSEIQAKNLGSSGSCNQDVDCIVGGAFDSLKDRLKHSVAFIIMQGFVCTGTLVNNTRNDKAPYFLTANHCTGGSESTWAFRFNWISPDPSCATTEPSVDAVINQTTSGATQLASNPESDFKLLSLDGGFDPSWDLEWAGWDRTGNIPKYAVGIHHPSGDIMKICREDNELSKVKTSIGGIDLPVESWKINDWDLGVTEGGSSGSALFDPKGRIVGQLSGGGASCSGANDNNLPDYYGRFDVSWDFGTTDDTRLSNWLDPINSNKQTLDMLNLPSVTDGEEVSVFFNTSKAVVTVSNNMTSTVLDYMVYDISGQLIDSGKLYGDRQDIDMQDKSSGMYFIYIKNILNGASFTKKIIVNQRF
ncbi:trypsin-like peptidase domain-containing protein [Aquimarina muelleri]|uniref:trypsin-like peptidase domain-containing protein n=1 Tax=Aquimarina muelleri TaxID=279356 RepID=UPI001678A99E|nr:T9SS type A sorting domain-containing protein [Aquimarina muelleri]MCX2762588.1 T9SS type A sorting domain-containing protein [Aquimarina muelleri]